MKYLLALLFIAASVFAATASFGDWRSQDGEPVSNTDARKSIDGFGAAVIITSDADWESKWKTPPSTTPNFSTTDKLKIGEQATILIFFANPKQDTAGSVDVTCDIKVTRPDGRVSDDRGLKGYTGKLREVVTNTFLTETAIRVVGEPTDPLGEWVVEITVHDNVRHVSVPLRTKFTLTK